MGMYIMNGKTFLKTYIHEDPTVVLDTQYVIVSSMIRKAGRYEKQVINAAGILYPPMELIVDREEYGKADYKELYFNHLMGSGAKPFIATLISYCFDTDENIVILCGKREWDYKYLQLLKEFIFEEFGFHIYDYKKVKSGKEKVVEQDESAIMVICRRVLKKAKKEKDAKLKSTEKGRKQYIDELDKSEMIRKLKKKNLYVKGMSKGEMKETLSVFF